MVSQLAQKARVSEGWLRPAQAEPSAAAALAEAAGDAEDEAAAALPLSAAASVLA